MKRHHHQRLGPVSKWERKLEKRVSDVAHHPIARKIGNVYHSVKKGEDNVKTAAQVIGALGAGAALAYGVMNGIPGSSTPPVGPDFKDSYFHLNRENYDMRINENLKDIIDNISIGVDQDATRDLINMELGDHIAARIEAKKQALAHAIFNGVVDGEDE